MNAPQEHEAAMEAAREAFSPHCTNGSARDRQVRSAIRAYLVALGDLGSIDAQAIVHHYVDAKPQRVP